MYLALALTVAGWLGPRPASAADPPTCAAAAMVRELAPAERDALTRVCEGAAAPDDTALQSAIFRMVSLSGWRSAALARLLEPLRGQRASVVRPGAATPPALTKLALRPDALAGPACLDLQKKVQTFITAREQDPNTPTPFIHDDTPLLRCLRDRPPPPPPRPGATRAEDAEPPLPGRLVALRADSVEDLFVAAAAPGFATFLWLQPADALAVGKRRFFVVEVPAGAAVAVVARLTNTDVPATWGAIVSENTLAWDATPDLTCANLDVRLEPTTSVYVDGVPMPRDERGVSRVLTVPSQDHELVALECPPDQPCHVRYRETLALAQHAANTCLAVPLDLAARTRTTITVLDAAQGEACREAPLRADGLRQRAVDHLHAGAYRESHEFRDLAAYAAATDAMSSLRTRLQPAAGTTTGANTGDDGSDLIGTAAKEAWRQGLDVLLSFDLQCTRRGDAWTYRLTATRVALSSMFRRGRHGGESLDLRRFITPVTEEFHAAERLPVALVDIIDRSLGAPYLRLLTDRTAQPYRGGAPFTLQRYPGPDADAERPVVVRARRLTLGGARPDVCRQLESSPVHSDEQLASAVSAFATGRGKPIDLPVRRDPAAATGGLLSRDDRARLRGALPGWYLVLAQWADDETPRDAACVELTAPARELWTDVGMSLHLAPRERPDRLYARARLGYMHYLRPILGVGVIVGYAHTAYAWPDGRPAWLDLKVDGDEPLEWKRNALLLGGSIELRAPFARMPFELRLRATPTLSLGLLRLTKIRPELSEFRGGDKGNLDVDLDLHVDAIIGYSLGKVAMQHMMLLGMHALNDPLRRTPTDIRQNGGFFFGLGVGVGFGGGR